jgi:hypothetical protein
MLLSRPEDVQTLSQAVSASDLRADAISRMARQLLGVLRAFPRRSDNGHDEAPAGRLGAHGSGAWVGTPERGYPGARQDKPRKIRAGGSGHKGMEVPASRWAE